MPTKLTLYIDESLVKRAERYSRRKKITVSKLVENYFDSLEPQGKKLMPKKSIARELLGFIKGAIPDDMDYKEAMSLMYEDRGRK